MGGIMRHIAVSLVILAGGLAACSSPEKVGRYLIDAPTREATLPNRLGRVVVRDVSLPQYASTQEMAYQSEDGSVRSRKDEAWADDPVRAVTLFLAKEISVQSGAQAIAEPWPFDNGPDRRLEVRIEHMLAQADGMLSLRGEYYVSTDSGGGQSRRFSIAEPITAPGGPAEVAAAQSRALQTLAGTIAQLKG